MDEPLEPPVKVQGLEGKPPPVPRLYQELMELMEAFILEMEHYEARADDD
jgi:hypothetical protein